MLYGNVIFIKKLGGDGSKFPVTIGSVKIGRSDDCLIRIQNPLVSSEHCEILIDECGQAKIRNLSKTNPTVLNHETLGSGEFLLKHKDIFKIGERLARWEYLPSSKYFNESDSNLNCPVADIMPEKRMFEGSSTRNSDSFKSSLKGSLSRRVRATGLGLNNKLSRHSLKPASSVEKNLLKRRSLQLRKIPFSPQIDDRGNMRLQSLQHYETDSGKKASLRKSQTWEIQSDSPSNTIKSSKKSASVKILDIQLSNDKLTKSCTAGSLTSDLEEVKDFLPKKEEISSKKFLGFETSDELSKHFSIEPTKSSSKLIKTPSSERTKTCKKYSQKSNRKENLSKEDNAEYSVSMFDLISNSSVESRRYSSKFTPSRKTKTRKSLLKKSVSRFSTADLLTATSMVEIKSLPKSESSVVEEKVFDNFMIKLSRSKSLNSLESSKQQLPKLSNQDLNPNSLAATTNLNLRPKTLLSSISKVVNELSLENKSLSNVESGSTKKIPKAEEVSMEKDDAKSSTKKTLHNRASKRKFTSFVASAERAAKKLKSISLTKPDKNKKAALLVLGKAGSKMKMLQNTNTIIRNKIVKKAIKQKRNGRKDSGNLKSAQSISTSVKKMIENKEVQDYSKETQSSDAKQLHIEKNKSELSMKVKTPQKNMYESPLKSLNERSLSKQVASRKRAGRKSTIKDCDYEINSEMGVKRKNVKHDSFLSSTPSRALGSENILLLKDSKNSENIDIEKEIDSLNNVSCPSQYDSSEIFSCGKSSTSKHSSSKSFNAFSNFIEASPTTLGISPRSTVTVFKTPKQINCSSLVTPKNKASSGIIKSASTSKINRKSVRFSSKGLSESSFSDLNLTHDTTFDFSAIQTPDISTDMFVSPLSERNSLKEKLKTPSSISKYLKNEKAQLEEFKKISMEETINKTKKRNRLLKDLGTELYLTMEQWQEENFESINVENQLMKMSGKTTKTSSKNHSPNINDTQQLMELSESKDPKNNVLSAKEERCLMNSLRPRKSPKNDLTDVRGVSRLMESFRPRKSPKNDLTDVRGVRRLMESLRPRKSPKNDLTDVRGVRRLLKSPRLQKSPKNDLTDVRGVRRLMESLRPRKSPKNDLTDVRGVRRLMESLRPRKSPKNDLTDVRGVRRLLKSPRLQKSPKNDLTDVRGVRRLMESLRPRKSPKNDLTDVRGVSRLMKSPRLQKSPKNDLTDVRGVRRLMESLRPRKSPKNDLTDVRGVRRLMESPKLRKSPKNDLTDVRGVRRLMESPKLRKSPKNDLTDVRGVRRLMKSPRLQKSPKNDLTDVRGVRRLMESPKLRKSPKNDLTDVRGVRRLMKSPRLQKSPKNDLTDVRGVRRLMESPTLRKSPKNDLTDIGCINDLLRTPKVLISPQSEFSNVSGPKSLLELSPNKIHPLNNISNCKKDNNVNAVHHLFSLNKDENFDFDTSGTGELFISPNKPRSTRKRLRDIDNIPYFMQVRVTRSSRGIPNEETKEISSPRKIPKRVPKTTKGIENPKIVMQENPLVVIEPENTISENQNKRITRSNKIHNLKVSLTSVEGKLSKNVSDSDFKQKEVDKDQVTDTDSINVEHCDSISAIKIHKKEKISKATAERSRRRLAKNSTVAETSPVAYKMTRNAKKLIDEKQNEVNPGIAHTSKTKKAVSETLTSTSESTSIRSRRKYVAEESNKLNTRSKSKSEKVENSRVKTKTKSYNEGRSSPVKTRQQRRKEISSVMEKKLGSNPVKKIGKGK